MTRPTHPADPAEAVALYLAGALPADERSAFELHLRSDCPVCTAELRSYDGVTEQLIVAIDPVAPDPAIRAELLARTMGVTIHRSTEPWQPTPFPGVQMRLLNIDRDAGTYTTLLRLEAGGRLPSHVHEGAEECLVLEGDLRDGDLVLHAGDYQRSPAGSVHGELMSAAGCVALIRAPLGGLVS